MSAAIESMNGARFVHDSLERGWQVEIADAVKVKGLAPLACKTDRIDAWVLAELSRRDLVPAIWLPDPSVRAERSGPASGCTSSATAARSSTASTRSFWPSGTPARSATCSARGPSALGALGVPRALARTVAASLRLIDDLEQIAAIDRELRRLGADHRYVPLLMSAPGIAWVLAYTIAAEIGDIGRFPRHKLAGYTGLCPRVYQSGAPTGAARSPKTAPATCAGR